MNVDLDIAQKAVLKPIAEIASKLGIPAGEIEPYGHYKAKLPLKFVDEEKARKIGRAHV